MNKPIEPKVSSTAVGTCIMRAVSYYEKNPCYKSEDFIAPVIIPSYLKVMAKYNILRNVLKKAVFKVPGIYEYVIARTKLMDEIVKGSADRMEQVLIFGAGFDSRAVRFSQSLKNTQVFELDAPLTQQAKINKYKEKNIDFPANLCFISIDFNKESLAEKLEQAGFQKNRTCLFILEGLTYYLDKKAIDSTFWLLSESCAKGSLLIFDYAAAEAVRQELRIDERSAKETQKSLEQAGEKPGFVLEEKVQSFLANYQFEVLEEITSACLAKRYFAQDDFALGAQKFRIVKAIKNR